MKEKPILKKDLLPELARLQESESRWRSLAESSPDHILTLAPDLTIEYVNHPAPGLTIEELIGKPIISFLPEDRQTEVRAILQGVIDTGQAALYETEYPAPGGEIITYETHAKPRKSAGKVIGLTLNSRDVTKRKQNEKELKYQEELIQSIFLSAPIGIGMVSNRIILQANDRLCEMVGYKREELINQNARMLYPTQEEFDFVGREKYDQISKAGTGSVETHLLRKDGEVIDVLLSSTPMDPDDLSAGVTFSVLDITERVQAQQALLTANNIINRSPVVAISWKNEEGWPVEFVSENVAKLLGYSVHELTEGTLLYSDIIFKDDITRVKEEVECAGNSQDQQIIDHEPYRIITKEGDIKWIADKTYIERGSRGEIIRYEGIIYDITQTIHTGLELRQRTEELAALLKTSRVVSSTLELETVYQIATDSIVALMGIDSAAIYTLIDEELFLGATTPPLDPQMPDQLRRASLVDHPHIGKSVSSKLPVILEDAGAVDLTEAEREVRDLRGLKTIVYLPLITGQQTLGVLILGTARTPRSFSQQELDLGMTLANQLSVSLKNANLHEELKIYSGDLEEQIQQRKTYEKALAESEQNFRDLVENLMDGVAICDENGFHIYSNTQFSKITGYSKDELTQMTGWDFTRQEDLEPLKQKMKARMAGESVQENYERVIIRKDGKLIPVEMATTTTVWKGKKRPLAIIRDIQIRKEAEQEKDLLIHQVQEANSRLKSLSRELINSQEAERKRIAQELHDELGQALTAISLDLGIIEQNLPPETPSLLRDRLSDLKKNADDLDHLIRELALDLRPSLLDDLGLLPTLNWYVDRFSQRAGIEVDVEVSGEVKRLSEEIETALYRIIQEALTNVVKHAKAKKVTLRIDRRADALMVTIKDNGEGVDMDTLQLPGAPPQGLGLIGMADRTALVGGDFNFYSKPGEGTRIEIEIPC